MKKVIKSILYILIGLFIVAQFIPRNNNNIGDAITPTSLESTHQVPKEVAGILQQSCYDCHSNHTEYPWYSQIQPVSWWLNHHVEEGKQELNFSEFNNYSLRRQYHKLEEVAEQVEEDEMPLGSYTLIHQNAKLSSEQARLLASWANSLRDSFQTVYPKDSLVRKRR